MFLNNWSSIEEMKNDFWPSYNSEKYKTMIDDEVSKLIQSAYDEARFILEQSKDFMQEAAEILKRDQIIRVDVLETLMHRKFKHLFFIKKTQ
jgi:ATP-dependent Zn protease